MATITFGLDISHHQDQALSLAQARAEGCEFAFLKATEGATYTDPEFAANLAEARAAGMLVAAYVYQRSNASAQAHVDRIAAVVPKDVPVIPDVEENSGDMTLTRQIVDKLRAAGYRVPLLYLPRWYWQQLGSPSLAGLPPLWSSRYPDYTVRDLAGAYAKAPASYWDGYGGLSVAVLQFTSSAKIAGHQPLDANAFRGTRDQLAALLGAAGGGGAATAGAVIPTEEEDMAYQLAAGANRSISFRVPAWAKYITVNCPYDYIQVHSLIQSKDAAPPSTTADPIPFGFVKEDKDKRVDRLRPWLVPVGAGVNHGSITYTYSPDHPERMADISFAP